MSEVSVRAFQWNALTDGDIFVTSLFLEQQEFPSLSIITTREKEIQSYETDNIVSTHYSIQRISVNSRPLAVCVRSVISTKKDHYENKIN